MIVKAIGLYFESKYDIKDLFDFLKILVSLYSPSLTYLFFLNLQSIESSKRIDSIVN